MLLFDSINVRACQPVRGSRRRRILDLQECLKPPIQFLGALRSLRMVRRRPSRRLSRRRCFARVERPQTRPSVGRQFRRRRIRKQSYRTRVQI